MITMLVTISHIRMCSLQGGDSVLHEATLYGQLGTISALLSTGMPVDVRNNVSCYIYVTT